ncbi:MAG: flagellar basal body rod protein FlgB [Rhodocyclaceae bacterium]|nr:flagellar basal body rod protein FlgB [Rhodocyclaceae bacterium]MBK7813471.1 flagellar basal body rod protein FlgB [Rhodocyclaceae bacterium]
MIDRIDQQMDTLRSAANLRAYRQQLLASNIANADTPNYKARDIDFQATLDKASAQRGGDLALATTSTRHLTAMAGDGAPAGARVMYRSEYQSAVDGNTVNMDVERSAFAENAVHLEATLTFIREKLRGLQSAIQGQ